MRADPWAINLAAREAGRARRAFWKASGLCVNCGKARDVEGHRRCQKCLTADHQWRARQTSIYRQARQRNEPWVGPTKAIGTVHPRIPVPLKGLIAMTLFYGLRRRVA